MLSEDSCSVHAVRGRSVAAGGVERLGFGVLGVAWLPPVVLCCWGLGVGL